MSGKWISWLCPLCVVSAAWWTAAADAAPPWAKLFSFSRLEADPQKNYPLGEENGPWMIIACSFSGEGAAEQARGLVYELRKRYRLPAYSYKVRFDLSDVRGRGIDRFGAPIRMRYRRGSELEEVAVLVGDYPAVDDPDAQKTLRKLKYARPKCLELAAGKPTHQSLAGWRWNQKHYQSGEKKKKGPMGHAFLTTNPLLPKEYYVPKGVDKLVLKMNKNVPHSLLDCPGKYTVQVARFTGEVILNQDEIQAINNGKPMGSGLAAAALKAHRLTEALRMKGYQAYEFHDRYASIVTVGSFDSVGTPRADGKIEINPAIHAVMRTFGAQPRALPGQLAGALEPKKMGPFKGLGEIFFDIQPIPVQVPKRSISAAYTRKPFGLW